MKPEPQFLYRIRNIFNPKVYNQKEVRLLSEEENSVIQSNFIEIEEQHGADFYRKCVRSIDDFKSAFGYENAKGEIKMIERIPEEGRYLTCYESDLVTLVFKLTNTISDEMDIAHSKLNVLISQDSKGNLPKQFNIEFSGSESAKDFALDQYEIIVVNEGSKVFINKRLKQIVNLWLMMLNVN